MVMIVDYVLSLIWCISFIKNMIQKIKIFNINFKKYHYLGIYFIIFLEKDSIDFLLISSIVKLILTSIIIILSNIAFNSSYLVHKLSMIYEVFYLLFLFSLYIYHSIVFIYYFLIYTLNYLCIHIYTIISFFLKDWISKMHLLNNGSHSLRYLDSLLLFQLLTLLLFLLPNLIIIILKR